MSLHRDKHTWIKQGMAYNKEYIKQWVTDSIPYHATLMRGPYLLLTPRGVAPLDQPKTLIFGEKTSIFGENYYIV